MPKRYTLCWKFTFVSVSVALLFTNKRSLSFTGTYSGPNPCDACIKATCCLKPSWNWITCQWIWSNQVGSQAGHSDTSHSAYTKHARTFKSLKITNAKLKPGYELSTLLARCTERDPNAFLVHLEVGMRVVGWLYYFTLRQLKAFPLKSVLRWTYLNCQNVVT